MRILYLHQYYTTPQESGGTRSYEMALRLVRGGHEVHMITSNRCVSSRGWKVTLEDGIHVHRRGIAYSNHMSFLRRLRSFAEFAWHAGMHAAHISADVIFASSTPLTIALPAVYAKRRLRVPMIFEVRDLWPEIPIAIGAIKNPLTIQLAKMLEHFAYRNSDHVVALSPGMKKGVVRQGYPSEQVTVIPNAADLERFDAAPQVGQNFRAKHTWLQDRPLILYTGTLGLINGVDYLVRLAADTYSLNPDIRFLVVGDGREKSAVEKLAKRLKVLGKNFFLHQPVAKQNIVEILAAADIATSTVIDVPELWSNSANKAFDAFAAGRPLAINHEGWLADLIRQQHCGLVLEPTDTKKAAEKLVRALENPVWISETRQAARRVARDAFDRNKLTQRFERLLTAIVQENKQPAPLPQAS